MTSHRGGKAHKGGFRHLPRKTREDMEKEFEDYWMKHRGSLLLAAPQTLQEEMRNASKLNTAGDWLLYAVPIIVMVAFINAKIVQGELPNFLIAMALGIAATLLSIWLKPYVTGKRRLSDIDADIKTYFYHIYQKRGLDALEKMRK